MQAIWRSDQKRRKYHQKMNDPTSWGEIVVLTLTASVKYLYTPPIILGLGYSFWETLFIMLAGGLAGILAWYFAGGLLMQGFSWLGSKIRPKSKKEKKKFSRKNKFIVRTKSRWGLIGLAIITPCIISIPIGTLLAVRYFRNDWRTLPYLLISTVSWAIVLTVLYAAIFPLFTGEPA